MKDNVDRDGILTCYTVVFTVLESHITSNGQIWKHVLTSYTQDWHGNYPTYFISEQTDRQIAKFSTDKLYDHFLSIKYCIRLSGQYPSRMGQIYRCFNGCNL